MLAFCQHPRPEGHVAEIPSGREGFRIPRVPPDVANTVAGSALDGASGISGPSLLGLRVVVEDDLAAFPTGTSPLVELWIVLAASTRPVRVQRCVTPHAVWVGEIGVFESSLDDGRAAVAQIAFQRHNG